MKYAGLLVLAACAATPAPRAVAPCPPPVVETRDCGDYGPPMTPMLMTCEDPLDLSPGSCSSINRARRLDHARQLEQYTDYVAAMCGLLDKPAWEAP